MTDGSDTYEAQLEALRQQYVAILPDKIDEIERAWGEVANKGSCEETLRPMVMLAHGLAGSGATFGFPQVSDLSRRIETAVKRVRDTQASLDEEIKGEIETCLAGLREVL